MMRPRSGNPELQRQRIYRTPFSSQDYYADDNTKNWAQSLEKEEDMINGGELFTNKPAAAEAKPAKEEKKTPAPALKKDAVKVPKDNKRKLDISQVDAIDGAIEKAMGELDSEIKTPMPKGKGKIYKDEDKA